MTDSSPAKPTNVRYAVLGWFCTLSMLTYIDRVCIKSVGPDMQRELGFSDDQFGYILSAFALAYALFEVPSGWLGDRLGPRLVIARIVVWWSIFTALTGAVWPFAFDLGVNLPLPWQEESVRLVFNSFVLMILVRFLFGAGEAGAYPNIARALRNWFPYRRRGLAQGLLWMSARWGGGLAPILIAVLARGLGWREAFYVFGAMGIIWVVGFFQWYRDTPAEHPSVNEAERILIGGVQTAEPPTLLPLSWFTMLTSANIWLLSLMYFCSNVGWYFFITWDTRYYKEVWKLDPNLLAIASGAPLIFGGVACLLGGFLTDWQVRLLGRRWGRTLQGMLAYGLGGVFFLVALFANEAWIAIVSLCLASFFKDFAMAVSWSTCIDIGHRHSGTVAGFMNMVGNSGGAVLGILIPWLVKQNLLEGNPWRVAVLPSACMFFLAAVAWAFINPRRVIVYTAADRERLQAAGVLE